MKLLSIRNARCYLDEAQRAMTEATSRLKSAEAGERRFADKDSVLASAAQAREAEKMRTEGASNKRLRDHFGYNLTRAECSRRLETAAAEQWFGNELRFATQQMEGAKAMLAEAEKRLATMEAMPEDDPAVLAAYVEWERKYSRALDSCMGDM